MSPEYLAFAGEFELVSAEWSLKSGRTATFRICGEAYGRNHPFKQFQQRRAGRVGTRFRASVARTSTGEAMEPMELMLMAWKDSSSIGQTVSFWLDQDPTLHPFAGCAYRIGAEPGEVFAVAIVELSDDDKPVRQGADPRENAGAGAPPEHHASGESGVRSEPPGAGGGDAPQVNAGGARKAGGGAGRTGSNCRPPAKARALSSFAHLTTTNSYFVRYLEETKPNVVPKWTPEIARRYAKTILQVESLSDLDRNPEAAARFENLIRKPFARWRYQHPE